MGGISTQIRICLFEGTYRKYHTELGLQSSAEKFLRASITASEELMTKGPYKLLNTEMWRHSIVLCLHRKN